MAKFDLRILKRGDYIKLARINPETTEIKESIERVTSVSDNLIDAIKLTYKEGGYGHYDSEGKAYRDRNRNNPVLHQILEIL